MSILNQFIQQAEADADMPSNVVSFREARAKRIRELAQRWAESAIELGRELLAVRDSFPTQRVSGASYVRPEWDDWCTANLDFTAKHAARFIRIAEAFGQEAGTSRVTGSANLLEYLARDSIPKEVRDEIVDRINSGEKIGKGIAKKIVRERTAPKPDEARKIARETGKPTQASDGNIYLGATKEQEQQAEERRKTVYDLRRAVETFANMQISADEFLALALPHQLWNKAEEHQIQAAYEWLTDLVAAWERR